MFVDVFFSAVITLISITDSTTTVAANKKPNHQDRIRFFFWGDWGLNIEYPNDDDGRPPSPQTKNEQKAIAAQVNKYATSLKPDFFAILGDNFYEIGVSSVKDPLWKTYYSSLYTSPATFVPWYIIAGNHDYYGAEPGHSPQAQIDYGKMKMDSRWNFPDYQYSKIWTIPGSSKTVQIVFIDTVLLAPEAKCGDIVGKNGFACPISNDDVPSIDDVNGPNALADVWKPALNWVDNKLSASTADFLFVAGHYHIYTVTEGDSATPESTLLQKRLLPLLHKYKVTAYIHAHEHNNDHFHVKGIHHINSGHGGLPNDNLDIPGTKEWKMHPEHKYLVFNYTGFATFGVFDVTSKFAQFKFINQFGKTIYTSKEIAPTGPKHTAKSLRSA